jgi:hypothetical protein
MKERIEFFEQMKMKVGASISPDVVLFSHDLSIYMFLTHDDFQFMKFISNVSGWYNEASWSKYGKSEIIFWIDNKIMRLKSEVFKKPE